MAEPTEAWVISAVRKDYYLFRDNFQAAINTYNQSHSELEGMTSRFIKGEQIDQDHFKSLITGLNTARQALASIVSTIRHNVDKYHEYQAELDKHSPSRIEHLNGTNVATTESMLRVAESFERHSLSKVDSYLAYSQFQELKNLVNNLDIELGNHTKNYKLIAELTGQLKELLAHISLNISQNKTYSVSFNDYRSNW